MDEIEPEKSDRKGSQNGRDHAGRYLPGHPFGGPGRPRGIDFRRVAEERAAAAGTDLEHELYEMLSALIEKGKAGDSVAAKLVFDRLCDAVPSKVEHSGGLTLEQLVLASIEPVS